MLNCNNISQYYCFYFIFDQINAALMNTHIYIYIYIYKLTAMNVLLNGSGQCLRYKGIWTTARNSLNMFDSVQI